MSWTDQRVVIRKVVVAVETLYDKSGFAKMQQVQDMSGGTITYSGLRA
jgi:hypothetical protein